MVLGLTDERGSGVGDRTLDETHCRQLRGVKAVLAYQAVALSCYWVGVTLRQVLKILEVSAVWAQKPSKWLLRLTVVLSQRDYT